MRILCAGEAMAELRAEGSGFALGFAGDTFNTAVYLRRLGVAEVRYLTRVGPDPLSDGFLAEAAAEGLDLSAVTRDCDRLLGIYAVRTDAAGERSFHYWRSQSAARTLFQSPSDLQALDSADFLLISGITLAILSDAAREALFTRIAACRARGMRLVFDSNHRPQLWPDTATARRVVERAWRMTDIALPSLDDEMALFGDVEVEAVLARLRAWGCRAGAIKRGEAGPLPVAPGVARTAGWAAAPRVVDTTAAGDSFNAGFLAALLAGHTPEAAMAKGHALAVHVVGRPGAIVDLSGFPAAD